MLVGGHRISARDGLIRANNYYRTAEFYLHGNPDDPRIDHAYDRARACFGTAAALFDPPIEPVEIPYENTILRGYFYRGAVSDDATPRPTIIMHSGFDGTCEELHWIGAAAAQERGYHVLTFDGPGQPAARRFDGLVFRPDWENVVTPVLDWLLARPGPPFTDPTRVALFGLSMGGLLAPRAAAFEHRLAACVAMDGVYDLGIYGHQQHARATRRSRGRPSSRIGPRGRRRDRTADGSQPEHPVGSHARPIRDGR
jgi:pimeloyl-ACP methyl ester carboxylesterase